MGNVNILSSFENIIKDCQLNGIDLKKAIKNNNVPYVFIMLTFFDINEDSYFGEVNLTYNGLLKQYQHLYTKEELNNFNNPPRLLERHIIPFLKNKYISIINHLESVDIYDYFGRLDENNYTPFAKAIVNGDADTAHMMIMFYGQNISSLSGIIKEYDVGELLNYYKDEPIWHCIYQLMNKKLNYHKIKTFINDTLILKNKYFDIYKNLTHVQCPDDITLNIMNHCMNKNEIIDIKEVTKLNNLLIVSIDNPGRLNDFITYINFMEKYRQLYFCLINNDIIYDIINVLYCMMFKVHNYPKLKKVYLYLTH